MKKVVITGSNGFIAKNLMVHLGRREDVTLALLSRDSDEADWVAALQGADVVFHLAGVNRPADPADFDRDNAALTGFVIDTLEASGRFYRIVLSSSTQAALDNPYGVSKRAAEDHLTERLIVGRGYIFRLPGVFGKWARPDYNSVVATYCYHSTRHQPLEIRDPSHPLRLAYVDDVVRAFLAVLDESDEVATGVENCTVSPEFSITLGALAEILTSFENNRQSLFIPAVGEALTKALYSTWLSYLPEDRFSYDLLLRSDDRGSLFELLKTPQAGQIFLSTTLPGITRGNHFHHTKTEKFVVVKGSGRIEFRSVLGADRITYDVNGAKPQVVDIPPGYTHNITNTGDDEMITLFWANEIFDPARPDTFFEKV